MKYFWKYQYSPIQILMRIIALKQIKHMVFIMWFQPSTSEPTTAEEGTCIARRRQPGQCEGGDLHSSAVNLCRMLRVQQPQSPKAAKPCCRPPKTSFQRTRGYLSPNNKESVSNVSFSSQEENPLAHNRTPFYLDAGWTLWFAHQNFQHGS